MCAIVDVAHLLDQRLPSLLVADFDREADDIGIIVWCASVANLEVFEPEDVLRIGRGGLRCWSPGCVQRTHRHTPGGCRQDTALEATLLSISRLLLVARRVPERASLAAKLL